MKLISKKSQLGKILNFILILALIALLISTSYFLYLNIPRSPEVLDVSFQDPELTIPRPLNSGIQQFYTNMKFNHNDITYKIDENCNAEKKQKMLQAFDELAKNVTIISFLPTFRTPDIEISCTEDSIESKTTEDRHFIAGEGGAKEIIQTGRFNIITEGVILLYENSDIRTIKCKYPNVELHELMHVFGFDHVNNQQSLMYPFIESCDQTLDIVLIERLKELYAQDNLPDLYFENVEATKKGRYLDFNLTIKNSGAVDSDPVVLTIMDEDKIIEERNLDEFKFGSGISLQTSNLKLAHLNPDQISFIIDKENKIIEIDETNNIANIKLN